MAVQFHPSHIQQPDHYRNVFAMHEFINKIGQISI